MSTERNKDNNRNLADRSRSDINPSTRTKEASENRESDNDRKGRNVDIDLENQRNEISGRSQETTPRSRAEDLGQHKTGSRNEQSR